MSTHALPIGPARRRRRPPALTAARARLHSHSLDRELGAGIATWRTPLHAARALQLTGRRRRIGDLQRALHHISRWITVPD
jgi:hypothetical protein